MDAAALTDHLVAELGDAVTPATEHDLLTATVAPGDWRRVAELLRTESSMHPMLIVLDDLQWADPPSLKIIEHVLRHELPGRVMVIATVRVPAEMPVRQTMPLAAGACMASTISSATPVHSRTTSGVTPVSLTEPE